MDDLVPPENIKILVVDDTRANVNVLSETLGGQGYEIFVALSGEMALKILKKANPDLILLDVMMPGIDGYEVCSEIKADDETKDIPIIFLTAKTDQADIVKGFNLGAIDYVTKPFQHEELLARVDTQVRLRKIQREKEILSRKIAESEKNYRTIIEKVPELIFKLDEDRKIVFANPAFKLMGYEPEELIGDPIDSLIEADDMEDVVAELATRYVGPLATSDLEVVLKVNADSTIFEHMQSRKFSVYAVGMWDVSDEDAFKEEIQKNFLGTLCIATLVI
jgi:two-component system sensor kinase FixL